MSYTRKVRLAKLGAVLSLTLAVALPYYLGQREASAQMPGSSFPTGSVNATLLGGRPVSTAAPAAGDVLAWSGTVWGPNGGGSGYVTLGTAQTITGVKTFAGGGDPLFAKEVNHTLTVNNSTTASAVGASLYVVAANGAASSGGATAGAGGASRLIGGNGGAGSGVRAGGTGGGARLVSGDGGAGTAGAAGGLGGSAVMLGGAAGTNGGGGGGVQGGGVQAGAGAGAAANGASAATPGGNAQINGGVGGAGSALAAAAAGGFVTIVSGNAGADGGGGGAVAGDVFINTGSSTGAAAEAAINIGQFRGSPRIGRAAGSLGFYGAAVVTQRTAAGTTGVTAAGAGTQLRDDTTMTGGVGATAYTVGDVILALKQYGLLAQ